MPQSAEVLLSLLRNALGAASDAAPLKNALWGEVYRLAAEQGVLAIAADGLQRICDSSLEFRVSSTSVADLSVESLEKSNSLLSEDFYYSWLGQVMLQEQEYARHCRLIATISAMLSQHGIRMLLLKGVACSLNYPTPSHRSVGDIDIFCFEKGVEANRLFESKGIEVAEHLGHHSRLMIDGVSIENHHLLMDEDNYLSNRQFESEIQDLLAHDIEEAEIGGGQVLIPGPTLMTLHLLRHSSGDFVSNTMCLRQMLDYALLANKRSGDIDWDKVMSVADKLGMRGFFDAMNDIAVNVLGIAPSKFPAFKSDAALRERILNDTLYGKKCHDFPDHRKKITYGLAKTRQAWSNRWKNELVFNEGFLSLYWQKARNRLEN